MFGKLVLILATVSQARHLRGPGQEQQFNITNATPAASGPAVAVNSSFSLVPYYQPQRYPMCHSVKSKQVAVYKNSTAFRREL